MRPAPMLDKINSLPGAERELAANHRHMQRYAVEHRFHMRRHVVGPFDIMDPGRVLGREPIERGNQDPLARLNLRFPGWSTKLRCGADRPTGAIGGADLLDEARRIFGDVGETDARVSTRNVAVAISCGATSTMADIRPGMDTR